MGIFLLMNSIRTRLSHESMCIIRRIFSFMLIYNDVLLGKGGLY